MTTRFILVSGASIAGPTLAHWLLRRGFQPTVVERAPAPRLGGQAVDLRGTAREVVERMGILDSIRRAHTGARGLAFVDATGRRVASVSAELMGDSGGYIADLEILRGDLVRILMDATCPDVEYVFDDSIASLTERGDGVDVTFERGAPRRFDLVVGADGLHSNVRALAFGADAGAARDLGCHASIFTARTDLDLDGWELMHSMPGRDGGLGKTVGLYPTRVPGEAKAMFFFAGPEGRHDPRDVAGQKAIVAEAFADGGWEIPRLLAQLERADDFYFDRVVQMRLDRWSRGRVVLVGDAAHCASPLGGNGTSLAIVGAYVLARELAAIPDDHARAFARYEQEMRDYVARSQAFALKGVRGLLPRSRAQIWLRNQVMRVLPYLPLRGALFGEMQRVASTVKLEPCAA